MARAGVARRGGGHETLKTKKKKNVINDEREKEEPEMRVEKKHINLAAAEKCTKFFGFGRLA